MELTNQLLNIQANFMLDTVQQGAIQTFDLKSLISEVFMHYFTNNETEHSQIHKQYVTMLFEDMNRIVDASYLEHLHNTLAPLIQLQEKLNFKEAA